jgi:UDP-N-acetyl-D-glucosamine dehydrogenase
MVVKEIAKLPITLDTAKILLLGVAFKKDVSDTRHSPAMKVAEFLRNEGIRFIHYYDPHVPEIEFMGETLQSQPELSEEMLVKYDVVVVTTNHTAFDYNLICSSSKVVVDTRNACKEVAHQYDNIILLGSGR